MAFTFAGLVLVIITASLVGFVFLLHPAIRKATNTYSFWLCTGVVLMTYIAVFRFYPDIITYATNQDRGSTATSKAFLLDICPFMCFTMCALMIIDYKRWILRHVAPIAFFCGLVTIIPLIFSYGANPELTFQWIFLGIKPNALYFMLHLIMVVFGFMLMLNNRQSLRACWWSAAVFAGFIAYVLTISNIFDVTNNVSGLVANDWNAGGEFYYLGQFIDKTLKGNIEFGYKVGAIYIGSIIVIFVWIAIVRLIQKLPPWNDKYFVKIIPEDMIIKDVFATDPPSEQQTNLEINS